MPDIIYRRPTSTPDIVYRRPTSPTDPTGSQLPTSAYTGNRPTTTIPIQPEVGRSPFAEQNLRPTMGNGVSSNQGNLPAYGKRDVRRAADRKQHDWFELAVAPETNSLSATANPYNYNTK